MLSFFTRKPAVGGLIGYFGLEGWWRSTFTDAEREHIVATFQPLGSSADSLTSGEIAYTSESGLALLGNLAGWFSKQPDRPIARRILAKAEELAGSETRVLDKHFFYQAMIEFFYRDRDEPGCLDRAIDACQQQMALAPQAAQAFTKEFGDSVLPGHKGYQQLAIILEKQERFQEAIDLCGKAALQGWGGDWAGRIDRCSKKMAKTTSKAS